MYICILRTSVARIFMFYASADRRSMDMAVGTLSNRVAFISWHYYENCGSLSLARNWEI